ncbi:MAG: helix-turn-helix transcriptional regulator [Ruminococcus sp.]|nr:helix-turn-helix transcriptional regulator [Ruminococcus sp.]
MFERLRELCVKNGIAITDLCKQITGSSGNLPTWKKGNIKADTLIKIADYFDISVDYLLGRTENPILNMNNSIKIGDNSVNNNGDINISTSSDSEITEIADMMKGLSLVQRSKIVVMIDEMKKEN